MRLLKRLLYWLGVILGLGGGTLDPFAHRLAPVKKRPPQRGGAVAIAEPDDD
ncbi:MAG TPA: hypothetical protein VLV86_04485 [Vicinamibacterales bacterium]|nr:hypothetical protein [Vicinamibacterales bacterium]